MSEAPADILRELSELMRAESWPELAARAEAAVTSHPDAAELCGFVAHAKRHLGELEDGYAWAVRGVAIDARNTFSVNRVSLLANLTGRFAEAFAAARSMIDREVATAQDAQNVAVTIVNGIYAASRLDKVAEAVELFTPAIERLDHAELHFNSACLYALAKDDRVFAYLAKSLAAEKTKADFDDADFDRVRDDPRFVELLARDWPAENRALARAHKTSRADLRPEDFLDPANVAVEPTGELQRNLELERAIDANSDDLAGYLVYSDWLQERQDPLGLFVLASRRCAEARTEGERMLAYVEWANQLHRHGRCWLGPLVGHLARETRAGWQHGFIRELVFDLGYSLRSSIDAPALLVEILALPMCRFVQTLVIGDVPADDELDYAPVVDALVRANPPCLRALEIGPNSYQVSWTHLDATPLAVQFPALESLVLGGGHITTGALDFPQLRRFAIRTGGLVHANLDAIGHARWPELAELEIWFGDSQYGADEFIGVELVRILSGRTLPMLRRLGLMNAEFTDTICRLLVDAPILEQLAELDLSMGTMTDEGASTLAAAAPRFHHLAKLSVAENMLSPAAATALASALPNVVIGEQKNARYVSVGE